MCGGALRRYLLDLGVLPKTPLVAGVPVSVRGKDQGSGLGNEVAFTLTHLGTHLEDPLARLIAIRNCMNYNKRRNRALLPGQLLTYAALMLLPGAATTLLRLAPDNVLGNVVISHVPGPRKPLYWQGARLTGLYPLSLLFDYGALNITVVSRQDFVDFGLLACPKTVPGMQRLLEFLEDALKELEAAVPKSADRPAQPPAEPVRGKSEAETT
jgi:diacylglycerol O-acyltransferase